MTALAGTVTEERTVLQRLNILTLISDSQYTFDLGDLELRDW